MQESGIDLGFDALNINEKFQPSIGFYATSSIPLDDAIRYLYDFFAGRSPAMCVPASKNHFAALFAYVEHRANFSRPC